MADHEDRVIEQRGVVLKLGSQLVAPLGDERTEETDDRVDLSLDHGFTLDLRQQRQDLAQQGSHRILMGADLRSKLVERGPKVECIGTSDQALHRCAIVLEHVLDKCAHDGFFGGKVLIEAADADPGDLGNAIGGECIGPLTRQNASRSLDNGIERGASAGLNRSFSGLSVDHDGALKCEWAEAPPRLPFWVETSRMILVVGAGPGGLAAALALQKAGFDVRVWERAPRLSTAGAGLTVQINAMRVLAELGVAKNLEDRGEILVSGAALTHRGRVLQSMPLQRFAARFGRSSVAAHRGDVSRTLAEALHPETIVFDRSVQTVEVGPKGVLVRDAKGHDEAFELVVGADGIRSAVRQEVFGDIPLRYSGYTCWRGIAPVRTHEPGRLVELWGPGRRFGCVPIGGDRTYWFATQNAPARGKDGTDVTAELLERFAEFPSYVTASIEATPSHEVLRNDILDLPRLSTWSQGRVTLLGDAAHAMTPNLGQGACQAIEDGIVLAASLRQHGLDDGPREYEAIRRPRTAKIAADSRRIGELGQLSNRALRWIRDRVLPRLANERAIERTIEPLYGVAVPSLG